MEKKKNERDIDEDVEENITKGKSRNIMLEKLMEQIYEKKENRDGKN